MDARGSGPPLEGRRTRLRTLVPADYDYLYALATNEQISHRWQYRGATPSPEAFAQALWRNCLAQFIVEHKETRQRIGHVTAYDASERHGWCRIAVAIDPALSHQGWALESFALFFNYLFTTWNFRKLYGEMLEPAYADMASGANRWFRVEGRLHEHEWYDGRYWDLILLALHRDDWDREGRPLVEKLTRPVQPPIAP